MIIYLAYIADNIHLVSMILLILLVLSAFIYIPVNFESIMVSNRNLKYLIYLILVLLFLFVITPWDSVKYIEKDYNNKIQKLERENSHLLNKLYKCQLEAQKCGFYDERD